LTGVAVVVETVFAWPGIGRLLIGGVSMDAAEAFQHGNGALTRPAHTW